MTEEEYKTKLKGIEDNFELSKRKLNYEYAMSTAIFKVGDIIGDSRWSLLIDRITVSAYSYELPKPVYHGLELRKDLSPRKDGSRVCIYGNDAKLIKSKTNGNN